MNIRDWYSTIEYSPLLIIKWSILEYKSRFKGDRKIQTEFRELTNILAIQTWQFDRGYVHRFCHRVRA